jgi:hypothetical protein
MHRQHAATFAHQGEGIRLLGARDSGARPQAECQPARSGQRTGGTPQSVAHDGISIPGENRPLDAGRGMPFRMRATDRAAP